ncbi:hypothetical protein GE061_014447 [Apolygus lucorum]|uniref:Uncharacterized protein n=1 Tax=Apolygus lucorum TaxID=248454 RepID=A0A8S9XQN5_APOLU|nr:hypothetical protein GE061_014447 [Apolygus lucorum]
MVVVVVRFAYDSDSCYEVDERINYHLSDVCWEIPRLNFGRSLHYVDIVLQSKDQMRSRLLCAFPSSVMPTLETTTALEDQ